jgi:hypothetical protein
VNDSFESITSTENSNNSSTTENILKRLSDKVKVVEYFNGVTLDEAIKSNDEIDNTAKKTVGNEKNSIKKAYLLYKWVSQNIKYDTVKAISPNIVTATIPFTSLASKLIVISAAKLPIDIPTT